MAAATAGLRISGNRDGTGACPQRRQGL